MAGLTLDAAKKRYKRALRGVGDVDFTFIPTPPLQSPQAETVGFWDLTDESLNTLSTHAFKIDNTCRPTTPCFFVYTPLTDKPPDGEIVEDVLGEALEYLQQMLTISTDPVARRAYSAAMRK